MSICELWVARCAVAAIDSGFDLDLLSFGEERTFFSRDYDASMVHSVSLTFDVDSITVAPSEDENVHLSWYSRNPQKDELSVTDGILSLKAARKSLISLNVRNYDAVLSLPADFDGKLRVSTSTGSISVSDLKPNRLALEATTGSIRLSNLNVAESITAETSTGSVYMTNVASAEIARRGSTGSAKLTDVSANALNARVTTGSIALDAVDAQSLNLRATTGSISGTLAGRMADYTIRSPVSTGTNSLPEALDGGARTLNADTTTGSIRLSFADAK